jgi:hypothetical protein
MPTTSSNVVVWPCTPHGEYEKRHGKCEEESRSINVVSGAGREEGGEGHDDENGTAFLPTRRRRRDDFGVEDDVDDVDDDDDDDDMAATSMR